MRTRPARLATVVIVAAVAAACGGDDDAAEPTGPPVTQPAARPTAEPATESSTEPSREPTGAETVPPGESAVGVGSTEVGDVLVDANGMSLYAFLNDTGGVSACYDQCAQAWPPVLTDGPDVPAELDPAVFSVTERDDGTFQLVAGDWPLYLYFEDGAPGDIFGQGVGEVWYLVDPAGELVEAQPAGFTAPVATPVTSAAPAGGRYDDDYGY